MTIKKFKRSRRRHALPNVGAVEYVPPTDTEVVMTRLAPSDAVEPLRETVMAAREAVRIVLSNNPKLAAVVANSTADDGHLRTVHACPKCSGKYHYVGRYRLPEGGLGLGGLAVCEHCGYAQSASS